MLRKREIDHQVLNARQDRKEAEIIAAAGKEKGVTVATNMAGRGTDIGLGTGVVELGGLHVISTEINEASRIDRQLFGRCGRQGEPGSYEACYSLEDELVTLYLGPVARKILHHMVLLDNGFTQKLSIFVQRLAQRSREKQHKGVRRNLLNMEQQLSRMLAFSGKGE